MTDAALSASTSPRRPVSAVVQARLKARYRAERRFRAYGLFALLLTSAFVVALLGDILVRGLPSFWQYHVTLDVDYKADVIDPAGKREADALRSADYSQLAQQALQEAVPGITGRQARRALSRLLSTGSGDTLRAAVLADPALIGTRQKIQLPISADSDLYLKANGGAPSATPGKGALTATVDGNDVALTANGPEFGAALAAVKDILAARARALRTEMARIGTGGSDASKARLAELQAEAEKLEARATAKDQPEEVDGNMPSLLVGWGEGLVKIARLGPDKAEGTALLPVGDGGEIKAGAWSLRRYAVPENARKTTDQEIAFLDRLAGAGRIENRFNTLFFKAGDSREPELAGIRGALVGSFLTLLVTLALCLPIGVMAAVYLEEFAPKNRLTEIIEVNINNLAAVPSIVFGLLGLAVFLNFFNLPRSAPLVGGLVLALLVLPTIIIAARAAIKAVPPSIKEAALGLGASHQQAVFHHVLPLAMPGIMTGTIIGMAHALGETAPLLMIGMVAFIVDIPGGITDAATVMPVQIYLWSDLPEQAFKAKTAGAIVVLLAFLFAMNGAAIWLRKRFERRW